MGDSESIVSLRDMYNVVIGTHDDVQRVVVLLSGVTDRVDDHETRIRAIEGLDIVTDQEVQARSARTWVIAAVIAGSVSSLVALLDFVIAHH